MISSEDKQFIRFNRPIQRLEWPDWRAIWLHRGLLYMLVIRDVRSRYAQTILGLGWIIVYPLLQTFIYIIFFGVILKSSSGDIPYALFVLSGVITWLFFSQTMSDISLTLLVQGARWQKIYFPRLLLPLTALAENLLDLVVSLIVLVIVSCWLGVWPTWRYLLLPLFILMTSLTSTGVGLWLAPLQLRYQDVRQVMPLVLRLWFFLSPIVYQSQAVPTGILARLYSLNPLVPLMDGMRWILFDSVQPSWSSILYLICFIVLLNFTGIIYFERGSRSAVDLV